MGYGRQEEEICIHEHESAAVPANKKIESSHCVFFLKSDKLSFVYRSFNHRYMLKYPLQSYVNSAAMLNAMLVLLSRFIVCVYVLL